jgi:hypothetical protein
MRRRDFIKVIAGAATALPVAAHAQPSAIPVVGYLTGGSLPDSDVISKPPLPRAAVASAAQNRPHCPTTQYCFTGGPISPCRERRFGVLVRHDRP